LAFRRKARKSDGVAQGWRSGLEDVTAQQLASSRVEYKYESFVIPYTPLKTRKKYTPDFVLLNNYIVIETKGRFLTADRQKHLAVKEQYPDLDLRFVFSNANARIGKKSKTTYAAWCDAKGFKWANKTVPVEWLREPLNVRSKAVVLYLTEDKPK